MNPFLDQTWLDNLLVPCPCKHDQISLFVCLIMNGTIRNLSTVGSQRQSLCSTNKDGSGRCIDCLANCQSTVGTDQCAYIKQT